jgi:hypothetical protein
MEPSTNGYSSIRERAEKIVDEWDLAFFLKAVEPDKVAIARHFLQLLSAANQATEAEFGSVAANGVLKTAVNLYMDEEAGGEELPE